MVKKSIFDYASDDGERRSTRHSPRSCSPGSRAEEAGMAKKMLERFRISGDVIDAVADSLLKRLATRSRTRSTLVSHTAPSMMRMTLPLLRTTRQRSATQSTTRSTTPCLSRSWTTTMPT